MRTKGIFFSLVTALSLVLLSCGGLKAGESFVKKIDGVKYKFEVIISNSPYVRISPLTSPESLTGAITIPAQVEYGGHHYLVTQIAANAFRNYSGITTVQLPDGLCVIEECAFQNNTALTTINTPHPLSVIDDYAFDGCNNLTAFSLDASLSWLGKGCFRGCSRLANVEFPTSFSAVPDEAFSGCTSLQEVRLSATVMEIGKEAFRNCTNVSNVYLDRSVRCIGDYAFSGCTNISTITCLTATPPICNATTWQGVPSDTRVTVPMASTEQYRTAAGWSHFTNYTGTY